MRTPSFSTALLVSASAHLLFLGYGILQDNYLEVKFTDVDYAVFTDGAAALLAGGSPYDRHTFRYTPLMAQLASLNLTVHPLACKIIFSIFNLLIGILLKLVLSPAHPTKAIPLSLLWLFNPLPIQIATRGSSDAFPSLLVILFIWGLLSASNSYPHLIISALSFGLSVHVKLYPIIFAIPAFYYLSRKSFFPSFYSPNIRQLLFVFISASTFFALGLHYYHRFGYTFIHETYLYHFSRVDHRHNLSPYFYLTYLLLDDPQLPRLFKLITAAQVITVLHIGLRLIRQHPLPAMFLQTVAFIAFNKVITAQYFIWWISLFPLAVASLPFTAENVRRVGGAATLWGVALGFWMSCGWLLEFRGITAYRPMAAAGWLFFFAHGGVVWSFVSCLQKSGKKD